MARNPGPLFDAILATNLPTQMLANDLRQGLLGHFANFGRILRFSCSMVKREKTAHVQYSSPDEARNALANGKIMNGHSLTIRTTDQHPKTMIMAVAPAGTRATFPMTLSSTSSPRSSLSPSPSCRPTQQQQQTLDAFFRDIKESKPIAKLESKPTIPGTCRSTPLSTPMREEPVAGPSSGVRRMSFPQEEKPKINTCVKLELYTPPPSISLSSSISMPSLSLASPGQSLVSEPLPQLRPSRSLRDVFFFDIPGMKVVKNGFSASDALACQFFTGGAGHHPFPLAMMFGRAPGSIMMPLNSIMNGITTGLEIKASTLELIWNSVENSVIKAIVKESAEKNMRFEKGCRSLLPSFVEQFLDDLICPTVIEAGEQEMSLEEDRLIICEDVLDDIIGTVCRAELEDKRAAELELARVCGESATSRYEEMETLMVQAHVKDSARNVFLEELCKDVVEELLDFYLEDWVEIMGSSSKKRLQDEKVLEKFEKQISVAYLRLEKEVVKTSVINAAFDEFLNYLCGEVIDDLLDCGYFSLNVKVVARNALEDWKEEEKTRKDEESVSDGELASIIMTPYYSDSPDSLRRTKDWLRSLPNSQSSIDSNYISPPPSSSSSLSMRSSNSSQEIGSSASAPVLHRVSATYTSHNQSVPTEPPSPTSTANAGTDRLSIRVEEPNPRPGLFGVLKTWKRKIASYISSPSLSKRARLQ